MMDRLITNVFPIENICDLSTSYNQYRVRGLSRDQAEYFANRGGLERKLSFQLRAPATVIERSGAPMLILPAWSEPPPEHVNLVRTSVRLERYGDAIHLDYGRQDPENDTICVRFLTFLLQAPLRSRGDLWQPKSGGPFFWKRPEQLLDRVAMYRGFSIRPVRMPEGAFGLCVDARSRFVSIRSLPVRLNRSEFQRWKGQHCIYHYGHNWYEIRLNGISDLNITEEEVRDKSGTWMPLLDYILHETSKPIPEELARVPGDAAVVSYLNNQTQERKVPAALCFPVVDTEHGDGRRLQRNTILDPQDRLGQVRRFVQKYMKRMSFGNVELRVAGDPSTVPPRNFVVPDLAFGGGELLSVRGTTGARVTSVGDLGRDRAQMLTSRECGFFDSTPLNRQYLVLPRTVMDSYGQKYIRDLSRSVDDLFPQEHPYEPHVIAYNDRTGRTFADQGTAIVQAVRSEAPEPGHALIMIHETKRHRNGGHDELAALVVRELYEKCDIVASVNHSETAQQSYREKRDRDGELYYTVPDGKRGRLNGYLRNVALNKILLLNERWPFVLATPTHADVIIGIDVKNNTAGFALIGAGGAAIRTRCSRSRQKEKLHHGQVSQALVELIEAEREILSHPIEHIVIHRDGRLWDSEHRGIDRAVDELKRRGLIANEAEVTALEISKTSLLPFRLFEPDGNRRNDGVRNPQVGCFATIDQDTGFICNTGRAFPRKGTVNPLHVRRAFGPLEIERCLEDVYALSTLAWSRPEDCSRYPISIKLTDRRLADEATDFDRDTYEYGSPVVEETRA
ncbi:MAG: hypothetical protein WBE26_08125 [Phycisphaerae bacterium]